MLQSSSLSASTYSGALMQRQPSSTDALTMSGWFGLWSGMALILTLAWADNAFFFSFAPKWLSTDGQHFKLVFTGGGRGKDNDVWETSAASNCQRRYPASQFIRKSLAAEGSGPWAAPRRGDTSG